MKTKTLLDFYKLFYNNNFYRDFRALSVNDNIINQRFKGHKVKGFKPINLIKWLANNNKKNVRDLYSDIYSTQTREELINKLSSQNKITVNKHYDRLYFDFDYSNSIAKELKKEINKAININDISLVKELRGQYIDLLLNENLAIDSYNEVIRFHEYLAKSNINSYISFSGSKGFHLYIFYPLTTDFKDRLISDTALAMAKSYKTNLNFKTMDLSVNKDAYSRIHRVPYTKHTITGLFCYPINMEDTYTKTIEKAIKPSIKNFILTDYQNKQIFTDELLKLSKLLEKKKLEMIETKKRLNTIRLARNKKKSFKNDIDLDNIDCRILANKVLGSSQYTNGNLNLYNCCFHTDKNPSLSVYKERFICGSCGQFNYYDFIAQYFSLSDSKEVIEKLKEIY